MPRLLVATLAAAVLAIPATAASQASIAPGMSREAVVARLGNPMGERTVDARGYLFYANGCERSRRCGSHDVVLLENDRVVGAIFRTARRRYSGAPTVRAAVADTGAAAAAPRAARDGGRAPARRGGVVTGTSVGGFPGDPPAGGRAERIPASRVRVDSTRLGGSSADGAAPLDSTRLDAGRAQGAPRTLGPVDSLRMGRTPTPSSGRPGAVDSTRLGRDPEKSPTPSSRPPED